MPTNETPETILMRRQEDDAARKRRPPLRSWPSNPRTAAPRGHVLPQPTLSLGRDKVSPSRVPGTLSAKRLKVTLVLDAAELLTVPVPEGKPRVVLRVHLPDRTVTADIATKSVRKAQKTIREAGADGVAVVLQGAFTAGDKIAEAGLSAQPKGPKPPTPVEHPDGCRYGKTE